MTRDSKKSPKNVQIAMRTGIGRILRVQFESVAQEELPPAFTGMLTSLESKHGIARIDTKIKRLRKGLKDPTR